MPDEQNQEVEVQANTAEITAATETPVAAPDAETPEVKVEPTKKRSTSKAKATAAAETPAPAPAAETPAPAPAAETPATAPAAETPAPAPAVETPAPAPAVETPAPVQKSGLSWGKRKESADKAAKKEPCEITITNKGASTFEVYTRTALPGNQATVVTCEDARQRSAIINKLEQLNALSGTKRYIIEG